MDLILLLIMVGIVAILSKKKLRFSLFAKKYQNPKVVSGVKTIPSNIKLVFSLKIFKLYLKLIIRNIIHNTKHAISIIENLNFFFDSINKILVVTNNKIKFIVKSINF